MPSIVIYVLGFVVLAAASRQLSLFLTRFRLPLISGYLLAGVLVGQFGLGFLPLEAAASLRFIDETALAFIAFAAGSELHLPELKSRFRSIAWHTIGQTAVIYILGSAGVFLLADVIPFMQAMPLTSRIAIALLAGAILVARSPSSAIAVVNELRAKGPFTKTVLGVTVVLDVAVVMLFAFSTALADALFTNAGTFDLGIIVLLLVELVLSLTAGYIAGQVLKLVLSARLSVIVKSTLILLAGFAVFTFSTLVRDYTHEHLPIEILLEPLLICMAASFWVTNFTRYRDEFLHLLETIGPPVYVAFFTLVGISLRVDILVQTFAVTLVIFIIRLVGLAGGSFLGGSIAGDPPLHNRLAWMAYVTQAGVGLGLARQAANEFPDVGSEFTTMIISVIVLSQIIGPPLLKFALRRSGETHIPAEAQPDKQLDVVIFGLEGQSRRLARLLKSHGWRVTLADIDAGHSEPGPAQENGFEERTIPEITAETLGTLVNRATDAIVAMLPDDADNLKICELAYEQFGIPRRIVRLNDLTWADRFLAVDALLVYPASAIVHLLDQFVRAPFVASLILERYPEQEMRQITISEADVHGLPLRNLRLPADVLVLGITRDSHTIVPHGATRLMLKDEILIIGHPESLDKVTLQLS